MASTGQTHDIICRCCKGGGHYARECPSKRVMISTEDGGYESASDYDEETLALIASEDQGGHDSEQETQYMAAEDADRYESLVAQCVLSVQVTQAEAQFVPYQGSCEGTFCARHNRRRELQQLG